MKTRRETRQIRRQIRIQIKLQLGKTQYPRIGQDSTKFPKRTPIKYYICCPKWSFKWKWPCIDFCSNRLIILIFVFLGDLDFEYYLYSHSFTTSNICYAQDLTTYHGLIIHFNSIKLILDKIHDSSLLSKQRVDECLV